MEEMDQTERSARENAELRERLSQLSAASLRIHESVDLDTVLQDVLATARSLTGARYGVFTLLDDHGQIEHFLASGMTDEEARRLWDTPDRMRIFEHLVGLPEPMRTPDLLGLLRQSGFPGFRPPVSVDGAVSFLAAPVLHGGERVAHIFVADRGAGPEFTVEDEETLVMFASQAALGIVNARRYRDERRARADLETLIDTSPVGVVVFDARTGAPVTVNREARRLADGLRQTDQTPEQLQGGITVRRADGREIALSSFSVTDALRHSETVRAEEITMAVPDGRSVTVLVNATPIRAEDGSIESFIATLQDLGPVKDLERLRAEFLAMVSDELRMPLTSIKGAAATALGTAALGRADLVQFFRIVDHQADRMQELIAGLLDVARIASGTLSVRAEPADPQHLVAEAARGFTGGADRLEIGLPARLPRVMADRARIVQVLGSLLSCAARRSPAGSTIRVTAEHEGHELAFSVAGQGGDAELDLPREPFATLSRPVSASASASADGGPGLGGPGLGGPGLGGPGLDGPGFGGPGLGGPGFGGRGLGGRGLRLVICRGIVEAHGGRLRVERDGPDWRFRFTLPVAEEAAGAPPAAAAGPDTTRSEVPADGRTRILALAADAQTLLRLRETLYGAGYAPVVSGDPSDLARLVAEQRPQLALLDLLLPEGDALELMDQVLTPAGVPTILLLPDGQEEAVAQVLDRGAADYVTQPFSPTELSARIRAALRRRGAAPWADPPEPYRLGELHIDYAERRVSVAGEAVRLTATEFELLRRLSTAGGRVLTHEQLLQSVWGPDRTGEPHLVRNVVKRLRRKLGEDADHPVYVFTEPRVGYRMPRPGAEGNGGSAP